MFDVASAVLVRIKKSLEINPKCFQMPSDQPNSTMAKCTDLIRSMFDVASAALVRIKKALRTTQNAFKSSFPNKTYFMEFSID